MNKRIQEFAHRCGFTEYRGDDGADDESLTKFAELIVQECASIAFHNVVNISCIADAEDVEAQIKEQFGVE